MLKRWTEAIRELFTSMDRMHREKAAELTEFEARELENLFVLLLLGSFSGIPSPPSFIAAELLPHLGHELTVMNKRAEAATDSLAELSGVLGID